MLVDLLMYVAIITILCLSTPVWLWLIAAILQRIPSVRRMVEERDEEHAAA